MPQVVPQRRGRDRAEDPVVALARGLLPFPERYRVADRSASPRLGRVLFCGNLPVLSPDQRGMSDQFLYAMGGAALLMTAVMLISLSQMI